MPDISDQLSDQFHQWERRGRGWQVYDFPVSPEPPFRPFIGHFLPAAPPVDDGRRPRGIGSFVRGLALKLGAQAPKPPVIPEAEEEPEPRPLEREDVVELQASLPANLDVRREAFEPFLSSLALCAQPISFELFATRQRTIAQFAAHPQDAPLLRRQLAAHFSEATFRQREGALEEAWCDSSGEDVFVVEFGLAQEFMRPLASAKAEPFVGLFGAMAELRDNELAVFQVLFQPARNAWADSVVRSVTRADGSPFFVNDPDLLPGARNKVARPLYGAVVRIAVKTERFERTLQLARDMAGSLRVFAHPQGNELIPLQNGDYPFEEHVDDMLCRQSRRPGMLLNSDELIGLVHLPGSAVRSPTLVRATGRTKPAPSIVGGAEGVLLGNNIHNEDVVPVRLTPEQRVQHMHLIGVQGTGKSTLLFNLIRQDIERGAGVGVLDPHGDLIDQILGVIPPERIEDVVLLDISDADHPVGFNILSAHSDQERLLLASDLTAVFERLSTTWGDQMGSVLQNAILAFLESDRGGTLADLRRFLLEPAFRDEFVDTVRDPEIVYYWRKGFTQLAGNKSIGSIITRLNDFLALKPIRHMVSQNTNRLDFAEILDTGKIFLAKLSEGLAGDKNTFLLGSLLVAKFQQLAMGRQAQRAALRKDFFLYIDEFHNFITPSMAKILSGARKYRLGLILAHQELKQLDRNREVASAVLSNPYTRVVFRVGDSDARALESGFSFFQARDFQNLDKGRAICRVEKSDSDFNISVPLPELPSPQLAQATFEKVVAASRAKYSRPAPEGPSEAPAVRVETPKVPPLPRPSASPSTPGPETVKIVRTAPAVSESRPSSVEPGPEPQQATPVQSTPQELGRGGATHKAIQEYLKNEAQKRGFLAEVEKQLAKGSNKAADLALCRGALSIGVEIALTTTTSHEFQNVQKCLQAGFSHVMVVSTIRKRLDNIAAAVQRGLGPEAAAKVSYYSPDEFIAYLDTLPQDEARKAGSPEFQKERKSHGRTVRRHVPPTHSTARQENDDTIVRVIAEVMRQRKDT